MNLQTDQHFYGWLTNLVVACQHKGYRPEGTITSPLGAHGIEYATDEDGDDYMRLGTVFPKNVFAEIDDGTFGTMQAIRIYLGTQNTYND